jgi:hypothetical protein
MRKPVEVQKDFFSDREKGSAIVIALLILTLLTAFVALAVMRTTNETIATSNDAAESRAFAAAQGSLEVMTRNFDKIFEEKLSPAPADLAHVKSLKPPGLETDYDFVQDIRSLGDPKVETMTGGLYQGLNATRDKWQIDTVATDKSSGVEVALSRQFINNRIPIFQFGIFYNDDLEFHPGPRFDFGGRVHANGSMFLMADSGLYFSSRVSAVGHILTDIARNGTPNFASEASPRPVWGDRVYIKNGSGSYVRLKWDMGSVLNTTTNGSPVVFYDQTNPTVADTDMPTVYRSSSWASNKELFQGNLLAEQKRLDLPLATRANGSKEYNELIKRGKNVGDMWNNGTTVTAVTTADEDSTITTKERYANKKGIRVSLADSRNRLPGCAAATSDCGIRLDGDADGQGGYTGGARGYQPKAMRGSPSYQATRINGERIRPTNLPGSKSVWIKIELVGINATTNAVETQEVTEDILSLGVTEQSPFASYMSGYGIKDSRSVIKLQRFAVPGDVALTANEATNNFSTFVNFGGTNRNVVVTQERPSPCPPLPAPCNWTAVDNGWTGDNPAHYQTITVGGKDLNVVPFPIKIFDPREGVYNFTINLGTTYPNTVPLAGVMSLIDVDVENLRKFLNGDFDSNMPASGTKFSTAKGRELRAADVPEANGWVLYVSDRRGDDDFDGEYDMEDVFGNNDGIKQPGEDVNFNGVLDTPVNFSTQDEAVRYSEAVSPAQAATLDFKYHRRAVRLINGRTIPGIYDPTTPNNTKGFTFATENGVYVFGNYNATGIAAVGSPTLATQYLPNGDDTGASMSERRRHIPASVIADAVSFLSNNWQDSRSFRHPFDCGSGNRTASETTYRFAMMAGDARSSYSATPNQGNSDTRLNGGVHNFLRFLENWSGTRLNYCGSIINLYNARNSNGTYKNSGVVRNPPTRNWVFDTSFLNPARLPPGTPFFQSISLTGFQRVN